MNTDSGTGAEGLDNPACQTDTAAPSYPEITPYVAPDGMKKFTSPTFTSPESVAIEMSTRGSRKRKSAGNNKWSKFKFI